VVLWTKLRPVKQRRVEELEEFERVSKSDLGQQIPAPDRGSAFGYSKEELQWAYEQGAKTYEDAVRLINQSIEAEE